MAPFHLPLKIRKVMQTQVSDIFLSRVAELESEVFGWSWIPNNSLSRFFVRLRMFNCFIFYITLLSWEFLLNWYSLF